MTEHQANDEVKNRKKGRPKKEVTGEKMWIPADCLEFVKSYLELRKKTREEEKQKKTK